MAVDIERCPDCTGECDDIYRRTAVDLLFRENVSMQLLEDKEHLLVLQIKEIGKCALSEEQIGGNLDNLIEVTEIANGREEVRSR